MQLQGVASLPGSAARATDGVMEFVALAQTAALPPGGRQATHLPVLVDRLGDPLRVGVAPDGLVEGVDQDHFEKLVCGILSHPVGVQHSQSPAVTASTLLEGKIHIKDDENMEAGTQLRRRTCITRGRR